MVLNKWTWIAAEIGCAFALLCCAGGPRAWADGAPGVPVSRFEAGADDRVDVTDRIRARLKGELARLYPGAKIELTGALRWTSGRLPAELGSFSFRGDDGRGIAYFGVNPEARERHGEGWVSFSAWVPARVAVRRIHPGERLAPEMFAQQDVNVASGQAHEYRGVLLDAGVPVKGLESRQSILEGGLLVSSSIERVPDVRRGDAVRVYLVSGGLTLTTTGTAEEPAYLDSQVRVMASKTKRELVGKLMQDGVVEVKL